jgi:uncharacterized protein (DUF58 family)
MGTARAGEAIGRWLFQSGRPAGDAVTLGQRQVFILPAAGGLLFAAALTVMYLGAINYSLGLGHGLVFLLAALGLTGMVHGFRNLAGLRLEAGRSEPVFAGEVARFGVRIVNPRGEARPALTLAFRGEPAVTVDVAGNDVAIVAVPCASTRRGWLKPPRLKLSTRFPLGFFVVWSYPRLALRTLVYPAPIERPLPGPRAGARPGTQGGETGDDDFAGLRLRQAGDPLRHVAWKAWARAPDERPLQVKRFSGAGEPELLLAWDDVGGDPETRLSVLTGWVLQAAAADLPFALALPERRIAAGGGAAQLARCLEALALHGQDRD